MWRVALRRVIPGGVEMARRLEGEAVIVVVAGTRMDGGLSVAM